MLVGGKGGVGGWGEKGLLVLLGKARAGEGAKEEEEAAGRVPVETEGNFQRRMAIEER